MTNIPEAFVVFKPLVDIDPLKEKSQTVIFFANPDQMSHWSCWPIMDAATMKEKS